MLVAQSSARAIRQRLMNPPNGHTSSDLEVVSATLLRKSKIQEAIRNVHIEREERRRRAIELVDDYLKVVARWVAGSEDEEPKAEEPPRLSMKELIAVVADFYLIHRINIQGANRSAPVVRARQVTMYLARQHTPLSFPQISRYIGNRDHTTAMHGYHKISQLLASGDEKLAGEIAELKLRLQIE